MKNEVGDIRWNELLLPWGKTDPYKPLLCHLFDAGFTAQALLQSQAFCSLLSKIARALALDEQQALSLCGFLVACHDTGKCHPYFQGKSNMTWVQELKSKGLAGDDVGFLHEFDSAQQLNDWILDEKGIMADRKTRKMLCAVLEQHHCRGRRIADLTNAQNVYWGPLRAGMLALLANRFGVTGLHVPGEKMAIAGIMLSGLTMLSDWIASNSEIYHVEADVENETAYCLASRETAKRAMYMLGFEADVQFGDRRRFSSMWPEVTSPRPMQVCVEDLCLQGVTPGIAIIEAPMGEGKTEAALFLAANWMGKDAGEGLYVALPTAATSNQMYQRIKSLLVSHVVLDVVPRLVHGKAFLLDEQSSTSFKTDGDSAAAVSWFRPLKRAILSPYAVGTVDQAMFGALYVKHFPLRLVGLAGKVLVIDEVHAYDAYMSTIIEHLLRWCGALGVPTILLSATLPLARRRVLAEAYLGRPIAEDTGNSYPAFLLGNRQTGARVIPFSSANQKKRIEYVLHKNVLGDPDAVADLALALVAVGGCLCVIANTVLSAQNIYQKIKRKLNEQQDAEVCRALLFHARFLSGRRNELEDEVLGLFGKKGIRPERAILVATQVVEQSLDIDFDQMISEVAPIDLLLQRAGRIQRHERGARNCAPCLHILIPALVADFGSSGLVYAPFILKQTVDVLQGTDHWDIPEDLRRNIEAVYGAQTQACEGYQEHAEKIRSMAIEAERYLIPQPTSDQYEWRDRLPFEEGDEGMSGFIHASTRQGRASINVIVLEGNEWEVVLLAAKSPAREMLLNILQHAVSVPTHWLKGVTALEGFKEIVEGPDWLQGYQILHLRDGYWLGRQGNRIVRLAYDSLLGMERKTEEGD